MKLLPTEPWLQYALLALLFWGLWGFLAKLSANRVSWQTMMLAFGACSLLLGLISVPGKLALDTAHLVALAGGLAGGLGFLFFYRSIALGPVTTVIPITALYVAVASVLAVFFLSEPISFRKILGIACAIATVVLLAE